MNHETPKKTFDEYVDGDEAIKSFPFFYRYFEPYLDNTALDVEDTNLVQSEFHQSDAHSIGFFPKKAALIHLNRADIHFKLH